MKKLLSFLLFLITPCLATAQSNDIPIISGKIFYQIQTDRIINDPNKNINKSNGFLYVEPNINLNINNFTINISNYFFYVLIFFIFLHLF